MKAAVDRLSAPQHEQYFFGKLQNPLWIAPLKEHGLFDAPPAPEQMQGGGLRCPPWPQSRYLARMAALAPDEVAAIFAKVPTENWGVAHDIVDAAKKMPSTAVALLVDAIGVASRNRMTGYMLTDVGELVARLAAEGQPDAALKLAEQAFALRDKEAAEARRRHDDHTYFEAMHEHVVPTLAEVRPRKLIATLVLWMAQAIIEPERHGGTLDQTSFIWRPAIEDHEQNRDFEFAAKLLGCLRDACDLGVRKGGVPLREVLGMIERAEGQVFQRLRLHLIAEFADQDPMLARATMMDRGLLSGYKTKHEYARLVGKRWPLLDASDHERWLSWVDEGPEAINAGYYDHPADKERTARQRAYWQFQRLHWIREHLTDHRRAFYERMLTEHGEPELADLNVYDGGMRSGHESPMSVDELAAMGFPVAVDQVAAWRPSPDRRGFEDPEVEGLAGVFQTYVSRDQVAFSREALVMRDRPPIYVRGFLEAMQQAVKDAKPIDLGQVLELARWVVSRPPDEASTVAADTGLIDSTWQWSRDTIASLVKEVAKARDAHGEPRFGIHYRRALWDITEPLLTSLAQSYVVRDKAEDPRGSDWPMVMLNSTRGMAMQAVLEYADWIGLLLARGDRSRGAIPGGLDAMPEVRTCLEAELTRPDADFAGRAAFGWRLGLLFWIDPDWLGAHTARIFDLRVIETDPARALGWAAWNTFLFAHRPHVEFYRLLRDQFGYAVDQGAHVDGPTDMEDKPWSRLGEHLMILYGRGDLGSRCEEAMAVDNAIIRRLVTGTRPAIRSHAIQFVGTSLSDRKEVLPKEVLDRFMGLWQAYWREIGREDAKANAQSAVFGYWFSSGAFDPQWSIERLHEFVSVTPRAEPDDLIVERLAVICEHDPLRSAQVIQMLVEGDVEGWRVSGWKDDAKRVLQIAMTAGDEARAIAEQVVDRLGRRGFLEFGELLQR